MKMFGAAYRCDLLFLPHGEEGLALINVLAHYVAIETALLPIQKK